MTFWTDLDLCQSRLGLSIWHRNARLLHLWKQVVSLHEWDNLCTWTCDTCCVKLGLSFMWFWLLIFSFITGSNGSTTFTSLPWGVYRVRIVTSAPNQTQSVFRRRVVIPRDPNYCAVNLINDGVVVSGNNLMVHFQGLGPVTGFECIVDRRTRNPCKHFN